MKITVDLPESVLHEIRTITGIDKKGPAVRKLLADSLMLHRRRRISRKFVSGEWSAELAGYEHAEPTARSRARATSPEITEQ